MIFFLYRCRDFFFFFFLRFCFRQIFFLSLSPSLKSFSFPLPLFCSFCSSSFPPFPSVRCSFSCQATKTLVFIFFFSKKEKTKEKKSYISHGQYPECKFVPLSSPSPSPYSQISLPPLTPNLFPPILPFFSFKTPSFLPLSVDDVKHPLQRSWTLWYDDGKRVPNVEWLDTLKQVVSVAAVEDFWG